MTRNSDFISEVILRLNTVKSVYLSIADMLYSAILVIADSFSWNQPNHGQTLIKNLLHSGQLLKWTQSFGTGWKVQTKFTNKLSRVVNKGDVLPTKLAEWGLKVKGSDPLSHDPFLGGSHNVTWQIKNCASLLPQNL